jgi:hypothetical protein
VGFGVECSRRAASRQLVVTADCRGAAAPCVLESGSSKTVLLEVVTGERPFTADGVGADGPSGLDLRSVAAPDY